MYNVQLVFKIDGMPSLYLGDGGEFHGQPAVFATVRAAEFGAAAAVRAIWSDSARDLLAKSAVLTIRDKFSVVAKMRLDKLEIVT